MKKIRYGLVGKQAVVPVNEVSREPFSPKEKKSNPRLYKYMFHPGKKGEFKLQSGPRIAQRRVPHRRVCFGRLMNAKKAMRSGSGMDRASNEVGWCSIMAKEVY